MKISIINLIAFCLFVMSTGFSGCSKLKELKEKQPNIVVFFVDDLGYNDVGFRNKAFHTPAINQLAKESLEFSNAYIASPTCSPSRSTLLTGKHPARLRMVRHIPGGKQHGFDDFHRTDKEYNVWPTDPAQMPSRNWLPLSEVTYAEVLKELGYKTGFVGKWHLGHEPFYPIYQGFDVQEAVSNLGHPYSYYPPYFNRSDKSLKPQDDGRYLTDYLTDKAVDYLRDQTSDQPFLLQVSYYSVHTPHQGRKDLVEKYKKEGWEGRYAHYGAMVSAVDESVGRIRLVLEEQGLADNTLVVFLSDQGGYFTNDPLRGGKTGGMALFEGGAKVPMLVHWPEKIAPGVCSEPVQSTDLFATFTDLAGGNTDRYPSDGWSILPLLARPKARLNRPALFFYRSYEERYASVLAGEWKLIAHRNGQIELFHLKEDPAEEKEVSKDYPHVAKELKEHLSAFENDMELD
jgi:arylsulfatase A-like enzyme